MKVKRNRTNMGNSNGDGYRYANKTNDIYSFKILLTIPSPESSCCVCALSFEISLFWMC